MPMGNARLFERATHQDRIETVRLGRHRRAANQISRSESLRPLAAGRSQVVGDGLEPMRVKHGSSAAVGDQGERGTAQLS